MDSFNGDFYVFLVATVRYQICSKTSFFNLKWNLNLNHTNREPNVQRILQNRGNRLDKYQRAFWKSYQNSSANRLMLVID